MIALRQLAIIALSSLSASCQSQSSYSLVTEKKVLRKLGWENLQSKRLEIVGYKGQMVSVITRDSLDQPKFYLYDEVKNIFMHEDVRLPKHSRVLDAVRLNDAFVFSGYFTLHDSLKNYPTEDLPIENLEFQELWNGDSSKIDVLPMHFIDKYYQLKIPFNQEYLICNPYTSRSAGYDEMEDGYFIRYRLKKSSNRKTAKEKIACERCQNVFIDRENYIYQKQIAIGNGFDGYHSNIYVSSQQNINDTVRIAKDVELISITPDGRYILGAKYLYGRYTAVIIQVETKKFQYILGRDYLSHAFFYSEKHKTFAFDFGDSFLYIDFPRVFPFDAMTSYKKFTKNEENEAFWKIRQY